MMFLKTLFLAGIVGAVPAQLDERTVKVDCKAVDLVVKALKIAPGASKYCSSVLKISTITTTSTISITNTAAATATVSQTVTSTGGQGGTITITAPASTETTTTTSTTTTTTYSMNCPAAANKRDLGAQVEKRSTAKTASNKCDGSPLAGYACSLISSACACLNLPTPTSTVKTTKVATTTITATVTSISTTFVPDTTTTTPTTTVTSTATATATACVGPRTCDSGFTCDNGNFNQCSGPNGDCYCLTTTGEPTCLDVTDGCATPCEEDNSCPNGGICALSTCCGNVCLRGAKNCLNAGSPRLLFRARAVAGVDPRIDPDLYTPH